MAITLATSSVSTANATAYSTPSFTRQVGVRYIVLVVASNTTSTASCVFIRSGLEPEQSTAATRVDTSVKNGSADRIYFFESLGVIGSPAESQHVRVTLEDGASGCAIAVLQLSVTGLPTTGAVWRQFKSMNNGAAGTAPTGTFTSPPMPTNALIGVVGNGRNPATLFPPAFWTELLDSGYGTPDTGIEVAKFEPGDDNATVTWGSSASAWGGIIIELKQTTEPVGSINSTLSSVTTNIQGQETIPGTLASPTLSNVTTNISGTETMSGSVASQLTPVGVEATGVETIPGSSANTLGNTDVSASGNVTSPTTAGSINVTLDNVAAPNASGVVANPVDGTLASPTLDSATMSATGSAGVPASMEATLEPATMSASGTETISGASATTLDSATMSATGVVEVTAAAGAAMTTTGSARIALLNPTGFWFDVTHIKYGTGGYTPGSPKAVIAVNPADVDLAAEVYRKFIPARNTIIRTLATPRGIEVIHTSVAGSEFSDILGEAGLFATVTVQGATAFPVGSTFMLAKIHFPRLCFSHFHRLSIVWPINFGGV